MPQNNISAHWQPLKVCDHCGKSRMLYDTETPDSEFWGSIRLCAECRALFTSARLDPTLPTR